MTSATAPEAREQVLSTLNRDGSRRWIEPRPSAGRFWRRRLVLAWALIAVFTAIPYVRMNGKPLVLLDIPRREFTFFGTTFLPTDSFLLMLLLIGMVAAIFFLTALFGRVWCGWACPQTVYMEYVFRPLERLTSGKGKWARRLGFARLPAPAARAIRYVLYLLISMFLAHTFLAYFVGVDRLVYWVTQSPLDHPVAFLTMALTTLLMLFDFGYFREQMCIVACPYGRFQSVLLDRQSLIVGYDPNRGEPRAKPKHREKGQDAGDCIDCGACVITCPTGIDIREGLQMECIGCTQCIDACDAIMARVGKPRGLIRYTSQDALEQGRSRILRPRVVFYPLILVAVLAVLGFSLAGKDSADVTLLRVTGSPYAELPGGEISNQLRVKIVNRSDEPREYHIRVDDGGLEVIAPENPLRLEAGENEIMNLFVKAPRSVFDDGRCAIELTVADGVDFEQRYAYTLLGPFWRPQPTGAEATP